MLCWQPAEFYQTALSCLCICVVVGTKLHIFHRNVHSGTRGTLFSSVRNVFAKYDLDLGNALTFWAKLIFCACFVCFAGIIDSCFYCYFWRVRRAFGTLQSILIVFLCLWYGKLTLIKLKPDTKCHINHCSTRSVSRSAAAAIDSKGHQTRYLKVWLACKSAEQIHRSIKYNLTWDGYFSS